MKALSFIKHKKEKLLFIFIFLFTLFSSYLIFTTSLRHNNDNSLALLASRFLTAHLALLPSKLPLGDVANYYNNFYLYFGPFPSILLMPFVLVFNQNISQVILGIGSMIVSFITVYFLSKKFKFNILDSLWLSLFFVFSTVVFSSGLINISAYQVEVLTIPLILLAIYEYFSKKRFLLIGILLGLAVLTRATLILAVVFFLMEFLQKRVNKKQLVLLLLPVLFACLIFGLYNQRRFHSFFETGYQYNKTANTFPLSNNLKYGYYNLIHIPGNLYSLLLMPPQPVMQENIGFVLKFPFLKANPWGMAIWYTSPLFLVLLYKFKKNKYFWSLMVTIGALLIPLLPYYSLGFAQFGYRYALDFLPFLFLLLLGCLNSKLSKGDIALIVLGVIFNCIYITSLWNAYPLFGINR